MKEVNGYGKGVLRRQQIIEECIHLLHKGGVAELSYENLAQALDLARPHIKYYFDSKEDLLLAAFETIATAAQAITLEFLESAHTWQDRLRAIVDATFEWVEENPAHTSVLFLYYHYCCVNPKLAKKHEAIRQKGRERIAAIVIAGVKGVNRRQAENAAFELQIYNTGLVMEMTATNQFKKGHEFAKRAHKLVDRLIADL